MKPHELAFENALLEGVLSLRFKRQDYLDLIECTPQEAYRFLHSRHVSITMDDIENADAWYARQIEGLVEAFQSQQLGSILRPLAYRDAVLAKHLGLDDVSDGEALSAYHDHALSYPHSIRSFFTLACDQIIVMRLLRGKDVNAALVGRGIGRLTWDELSRINRSSAAEVSAVIDHAYPQLFQDSLSQWQHSGKRIWVNETFERCLDQALQIERDTMLGQAGLLSRTFRILNEWFSIRLCLKAKHQWIDPELQMRLVRCFDA